MARRTSILAYTSTKLWLLLSFLIGKYLLSYDIYHNSRFFATMTIDRLVCTVNDFSYHVSRVTDFRCMEEAFDVLRQS